MSEIAVSPTSVIRWAGSKKQSIKELSKVAPNNPSRFIELFAGSACLFFETEASEYIISDTNSELIEFYNWLAQKPDEMHRRLCSLPRDKHTYYRIREEFNCMTASLEKSGYFWYLNRNCFNGIYRENIKGEFNVPFADRRVASYPSLEQVHSAALKLSKATCLCGDFEKIARQVLKAGDFIYLDPPFYVPDQRVFREYSKSPFHLADISRLIDLLKFIDSKGAHFLLSYPDAEIIDQIKDIWKYKTIKVRRTISGKMNGRRPGNELLFWN